MGHAVELTDYLITEHEADRSSARFNGDEITLLWDKLTLGIDESIKTNRNISIEMNEILQKINQNL